MDLASYAELAVRLVNTDSLGHEGGDQLATLDGLRGLVADRQHLNHGVTRQRPGGAARPARGVPGVLHRLRRPGTARRRPTTSTR